MVAHPCCHIPAATRCHFVFDGGVFMRFDDVDANGEVVKISLTLLGVLFKKLRHRIFITRQQKHNAKRSIM